jgi:hypothetical protein
MSDCTDGTVDNAGPVPDLTATAGRAETSPGWANTGGGPSCLSKGLLKKVEEDKIFDRGCMSCVRGLLVEDWWGGDGVAD